MGEGVGGSPVVAPDHCPDGGSGMKIAVTPDAGPGYVLNPDGSSCYGALAGRDVTLGTAFAPGDGRYDSLTYAALGDPAFGTLDGRTVDGFAPVSGVFRALDAAVPEYQGARTSSAAGTPARVGSAPGSRRSSTTSSS